MAPGGGRLVVDQAALGEAANKAGQIADELPATRNIAETDLTSAIEAHNGTVAVIGLAGVLRSMSAVCAEVGAEVAGQERTMRSSISSYAAMEDENTGIFGGLNVAI